MCVFLCAYVIDTFVYQFKTLKITDFFQFVLACLFAYHA